MTPLADETRPPSTLPRAPSLASETWQQTTAQTIAQSILTSLLYALPALICVYASCVTDPDIWWHLHTGDWILQHRAVPHADPFAPAGISRPWAAYSWLYELLVASLFARLSLAAIVAYTAAMVLLITAALHRLVRRLCADFNLGVLLTFLASIAIGRLSTPRPWLFTILFFVLELDILLTARRTGRMRGLALLPLIFALWANLHIQFVDGLLVLALAAAEAIAAPWWPAARTRLAERGRCGVLALPATLLASLLATLLNPYGPGIYKVAHDLATQPEVVDLINELKPIPFRGPLDYSVLALALAATALLARAQRRRPFETALLATACFLSFRSLRDVWFIAIAATAIIAQQLGASDPEPATPTRPPARASLIALTLTPALTALILFLGATLLLVDNSTLRAKLATELPVDAATFILRAHLPGPVYNTYGWGGYLMWSLHQPVAIDGRAALQGTEHLDRTLAIWNLDAPNAEPLWASDPELARAGIVIGPPSSPLFQVLRLDPRFTLAYQDPIAAVFIPRK